MYVYYHISFFAEQFISYFYFMISSDSNDLKYHEKNLFKVFRIGGYDMETTLHWPRSYHKHFSPRPFLFLSDFKLLLVRGCSLLSPHYLQSLLPLVPQNTSPGCHNSHYPPEPPCRLNPSPSWSLLFQPWFQQMNLRDLTRSLLLNGSPHGPRTAINPWYILPFTLIWHRGNCY